MTKPPTDLLMWMSIHYLGRRTDRREVLRHDLAKYLIPNLLTDEEFEDSYKRGVDFGIIGENWHNKFIDGATRLVIGVYLRSGTSIPEQNRDMYGWVILDVLAHKEKKENV